MIDFEAELKAIIENDPLDILKAKAKASSVISADSRLKVSFEEINDFIDLQGHEPEQSRDINERRLFSRLQGLRESSDKISALTELDRHQLFKGIEFPEPKQIETLEDVFDADPLGLLSDDVTSDAQSIFDLANLPSKSRAATDFVAQRKPCLNFEEYEPRFIQIHRELIENKRKLLNFTDKGEALVEGNYYILGGILLFLESTDWTREDEVVDGTRRRKDGRTKCIFENGTESNMYYRSLAKALYQGGKIVTQTASEINKSFADNFSGVTDKDQSSGFVYVLKSLSERPEIQTLENLYKVGFSSVSVDKRIANAATEPTYLMAGVHSVAEYEVYNISAQKFEKQLHLFFSKVCLDFEVADNKGRMHKPREWFMAPLPIIDRAIQLIINDQIQHYRYDVSLKEIIAV